MPSSMGVAYPMDGPGTVAGNGQRPVGHLERIHRTPPGGFP